MEEDIKEEYIYLYICITESLYTWNWHNIVNQPYFNKKILI